MAFDEFLEYNFGVMVFLFFLCGIEYVVIEVSGGFAILLSDPVVSFP